MEWMTIDTVQPYKMVLFWVPEMDGWTAGVWKGMMVGGDSRNYGYDIDYHVATPFSEPKNTDGIHKQVWVKDIPKPTHWMPLPEPPKQNGE